MPNQTSPINDDNIDALFRDQLAYVSRLTTDLLRHDGLTDSDHDQLDPALTVLNALRACSYDNDPSDYADTFDMLDDCLIGLADSVHALLPTA